jgi:tartrate dehydratase alpha subunit/fumarate hydratase class I-like protein
VRFSSIFEKDVPKNSKTGRSQIDTGMVIIFLKVASNVNWKGFGPGQTDLTDFSEKIIQSSRKVTDSA